ncbi:Cytochrome P450 [Rhypophila decipiens]
MTTSPILSLLKQALVGLGITAWGLAFFVIALVNLFRPVGKKRLRDGRSSRLPPGPKGLPLLGCLMDLQHTREDPNRTWLRNMKPEYGEMATVHLGQKTWIFLNSTRVVTEIITKRGSATSTRAPLPVSSGIMSLDKRSLLLPQELWQEPRRALHSLLNASSLKQYGPWQELESTQMMAEYLSRPDLWYKHHYRYANGVIHRIVLGERLTKSSRELVDMQNVATIFVRSIGKSVVDWFPDLARLPRCLQVWRPGWERLSKWNYDVFVSWWEPVRQRVIEGTAPPSFVRDRLLHSDTKYRGSDIDAMYIAMALIEAASDTTRQALNVLVMAAMEYPRVFQQARRLIDEVCGAGQEARLATLADMESLRYVCAMCKEVLRWRLILPLTPDHTSDRDIEFEGYRFPAGTSFAINQVAVASECRDPDEFRPERWMDGHEMDITHGIWEFGGGRRICVGYGVAQRNLFLNITRLTQCFDFAANGVYDSMDLNPESTQEPFPAKPTVRSKAYEQLIIREANNAGVLEDARAMRDSI